MFERTLTEVIQRETHVYGKSVLLLGPRQVGKSTLVRSLKPDLTINLARESEYRDHLTDPELLERLTDALPPHSMVFVDEVQRLPSMLNTVQAIIDEGSGLKFVLTGSSARKLKREGTNLLPGRVFSHRLFPLTFWELGARFDLETCLKKGSLPEIFSAPYGAELLRSYIDIYLREEVLAEGIVRNVASFASFLDVVAKVSGQAMNYSQLASDTEIPKESLRRYIEILQDTLIVYRLSGFTNITSSRKAQQRDKVIFFDVGVRNGILRIENNVFLAEEYGALFEQWLATQLFAFASYHRKNWKFYYYRDDLKQEVDLVIEGPDALCAVEVKWGKQFKHEWTRGLKALCTYARKPVTPFVVYRGETVQRSGDILVIPYQRFLADLEHYLAI